MGTPSRITACSCLLLLVVSACRSSPDENPSAEDVAAPAENTPPRPAADPPTPPSPPAKTEIPIAPAPEAKPTAATVAVAVAEPAEEPASSAKKRTGPVPNNSSPCEERERYAIDTLLAAIEKARAPTCKLDTDCARVNRSTDCRGACPQAIHAGQRGKFEKLRQRINTQVCSGYRDAGCRYATPRCQVGEPRCVKGACQLVMPPRPDGR